MSKNGEIVTFYSYKGGVGRSMALANVAVLLAQWGHRTLVVDWDLEAPGMQLYFAGESMGKEKLDLEEIQRRRGVLDLLLDVSDGKYESPQAMKWEDMPIMVRLPGSERTLDLITAGRGSAKAGSDYFQRLHKLDVGDFYRSKQGGLYIEELRNRWRENYDYVLIDSRAGVTDIGGICSIQLPDSLILMFTANEQSCAGAIEMARRIEEARLAQPRFRLGLTIIPVLSRFDGKEQLEEGQQWLKRIPPMLTSIYDNWLHGGVHLEDALANTIIPYWPFYSFGEELAVLKETTVFPGSLRYSYETLAALIATDLEFTELLGGNRDQLVLKASGRLPPPQAPAHQVDKPVTPERSYAPERRTTRVQVFLSYAEEDHLEARRLAQALERYDVDVWYWQDTRRGSTKWIEEIEQRIDSADAFVALVSPHFLTSFWCREEYHLALRKEQRFSEDRANADFVMVAKLADCDVSTRFLSTRRMLDLTSKDYDYVATILAVQIGHQKSDWAYQSALKASGMTFASTNWPVFVDRHAELELLTSDITNTSGQHFWSVIGVPGIGKTWLLRELPRKLGAEWAGLPRYVDLQKENSSRRGSGELLLLRLIGMKGDHFDEAAYEEVVEAISGSNRPWLLMVDGAEWLEDEEARTFRSLVSRLREDLAHVGIDGVPLTVVVAGRDRSESWKGVSPKPEFRLLELTHFEPNVVLAALKDMARLDGRESTSDDWFRENAHRLHRLSEGLPALLIRYMDKLRKLKYVRVQRLEREEVFNELVVPFVDDYLLWPEALGLALTQDAGKTGEAQREALRRALWHLCTFRILTFSHIKHVVSEDGDLKDFLDKAEWNEWDLRKQLSRTHLLKATENVWKELDPAIRRLLFRYFHRTPEDQLKAHEDVGEFYEGWKIPSGTEQTVMTSEALWHRTETIRLGKMHGGASLVLQYFQALLDQVQVTEGYERGEVLRYLRDRMMADDELQRSLYEVDGNVFGELLRVVDQRVREASP